MKKGIFIGALLAVGIMVLALGVFSFASAQTPTPNNPFGPGQGGMMGGRGMRGGYGMMGGQGMLGGSMHTYMVKAAAEVLGMTEDALNTELNAGKTLWQVIQAQGKTAAEIPAVLDSIREKALDAMVADGVITQAQADLMESRMDAMMNGQGGANGGCPMGGGMGRGGGRWNTRPAQPSTNG